MHCSLPEAVADDSSVLPCRRESVASHLPYASGGRLSEGNGRAYGLTALLTGVDECAEGLVCKLRHEVDRRVVAVVQGRLVVLHAERTYYGRQEAQQPAGWDV